MILGEFKKLLALCGFPQRGGTLPRLLAQSAVPASVTGTLTETTLATIAIPAGTVGQNGSLEITLLFSATSNANTKNFYIKGNGVAFSASAITTLQYESQFLVMNKNALNAQTCITGTPTGMGSTGGGFTNTAVDFSATVSLTISAALTNTGDTFTLIGYVVKVLNP